MMKFGRHCKKQFQQSHGKCPFTAYFKHEGLALNERNITAWQASLMHLYSFFSICTSFICTFQVQTFIIHKFTVKEGDGGWDNLTVSLPPKGTGFIIFSKCILSPAPLAGQSLALCWLWHPLNPLLNQLAFLLGQATSSFLCYSTLHPVSKIHTRI